MSLQNSVLEVFGLDFGGLGPLFWKVLGSIFEGFEVLDHSGIDFEASGLHIGRSRALSSKVLEFGPLFWKVWAHVKAGYVILGFMNAKNA